MKWMIAGAALLVSISPVLSASTEIKTAAMPESITDTQCEAPSQDMLELGDDYYDLKPVNTPSHKDITSLNQLYKRMQGRWVGSLTDTYCLGAGSSARMESRTYLLKRVEAMLEEKDLFILRSEKHLIEKRRGSNRLRTVSITPGSRMDFLPGYDLSSLQFEDENTVSMTARFRQSNRRSVLSTGLSTLRERQDKLSLKGNSLQIETRYFSNGYFTGFDTVQLTRR